MADGGKCALDAGNEVAHDRLGDDARGRLDQAEQRQRRLQEPAPG